MKTTQWKDFLPSYFFNLGHLQAEMDEMKQVFLFHHPTLSGEIT